MKKEVLVKFGNRVKEERRKQGLSQEQLAVKAGFHRTYIGMVERAEKNVTLSSIEKITNALGFEVGDFLKDL
jgi:transcriptional regulator with XRE-family HTH domain